jgi:3',5'-nucleoside bisphosphate phosphatase
VKPLLAELHAHTTWSDGELSLPALVDLYGQHRFDVLCVTDHTVRGGEGKRFVGVHNWRAYLDQVDAEAERARRRYGLLVMPGLELTDDHPDPRRSAHAVAIGLRRFVSIEPGLRPAVEDARREGAAIVAAHPHAPGENARGTCRWWHERDEPSIRPDRYELFNRRDVFTWVAERDLPCVASGDFHRRAHLDTWKTMLPCAPDEASVVAFLRSDARAYLMPFSGGKRVLDRLAA